jgi:UDP-N-acetylmuramoyl-tripeptide--D-alanyl-D-alanine ligase
VIDDSYNANPDSMRAAIEVLAACAGKRILVLGDMGELGTDSAKLHAEVIARALDCGIERIFVLGERMAAAHAAAGAPGRAFAQVADMVAAIAGECDTTTTVLVKGSRFMQMERVVTALCGAAKGAH